MNELNGKHLDLSRRDFIITGIYNDKGKFYRENIQVLGKADFIDYYFNNEFGHGIARGIIRDRNGIVVSYINEKTKYSSDYFNCTSIIAIGRSYSGKNISLLTHQDPDFFLSDDKLDDIEQFGYGEKLTKKEIAKKLLFEGLERLKELSEEGTIDIIILGGNNNNDFRQYKQSIKFLENVINEVFNFNPVVIGGPTNNDKDKFLYKDILVDTDKRRVLLLKGSNYEYNVNFVSNKVNEIFSHNIFTGLIKKIKDRIKSIFK